MNSILKPPTGDSFRIEQPLLHLPMMRGVIDRRILVNFRCDPEVLSRITPSPFRPKLVRGIGMAGICLTRLQQLRPRWLPAPLGLTSENAAHRIAVEWGDDKARREGVYIPRRDSNSRLNVFAGGRLFPGAHHFAHFDVAETRSSFNIEISGEDGQTRVKLAARIASDWPMGSVFSTLENASAFFAAGSLGWSVGNRQSEFEGLELHNSVWHMEPLIVEHVESSFFDDPRTFPPGTAQFDSALLMRAIPHEWHGRGRMLRTWSTHST